MAKDPYYKSPAQKKHISRNIVTLRLNNDLLDRVDALIPIFEESADKCSTGKSSRSEVIRGLLLEALTHYEGAE